MPPFEGREIIFQSTHMQVLSDLLLYMQKKIRCSKTCTSAVELRILEEAVVRVCPRV